MVDLRHDPGRGVRPDEGQRRRRPHQRRPPTWCTFLGGANADGTVLDPGLGLLAGLRLQDRLAGRQLRRDLRGQPGADRHRGARPQRAVVRRRPAVRPALPLIGLTGPTEVDDADPWWWSDDHRPTAAPGATSADDRHVARCPRPRLDLPVRRAGRSRWSSSRGCGTTSRSTASARTSRRASTTSTSRPASRSPTSAFRQTQPVHDALVEGLLNTLRLAVIGHRAGDRVRHADRRRPAVEELPRAQGRPGLRRDRPQRPAARRSSS